MRTASSGKGYAVSGPLAPLEGNALQLVNAPELVTGNTTASADVLYSGSREHRTC